MYTDEVVEMDKACLIQHGVPLKTRLRQFLRDTVFFVIDNDPSLGEEVKARVRSLRIPENESDAQVRSLRIPEGERDDFTPQIGLFVIRQMLRIRRYSRHNDTRDIVRSLFMVPDFMNEFFTHYLYTRCREWFNCGMAWHYLHFLIIICEFCCKIAELDQFEGDLYYILQGGEYYMSVYPEAAFAGYNEQFDYALKNIRSMPDY